MNTQLLYVLLIWFALISLVTAAVTVADKLRAKKHSFRVPERVLLIIAAIGGSLAEYAVMRIIRHKTLHKKFMIGLPLIMIAQIVVLCFLFIRFFN